MSVPTQPPNSVIAGDSASFLVTSIDYPVSAWTLSYVISTPTPTALAAAISGTSFLVTLPAATSATMPPGVYACASVFSNAATSERKTIRNPFFFVFPDPTAARSATWASTTLALVESSLATLASTANSQVAINGQTFTKQNIGSLIAFRDRLRAEVGAENAAAGLPTRGQSKTIKTRFRY